MRFGALLRHEPITKSRVRQNNKREYSFKLKQ